MKTRPLYLLSMVLFLLASCSQAPVVVATAVPGKGMMDSKAMTKPSTPMPAPTATPSPTSTPTPTPQSACKITLLSSVANSDIPTFEYEGEGFAVGEGIVLLLAGGNDLQVSMGQADEDGSVVGRISWINLLGVGNPSSFRLTLKGNGENCEATQAVDWTP